MSSEIHRNRRPRKTGTTTGNRGAIIVIVLLVLLIVVTNFIEIFLEDFVVPDFGIPYPILFIIIMVCVILVTVVSLIKDGIVKGSNRSRERNPSIIKRVIKDGFSGDGYIVSGDGEDTFGQACKNHWQFVNVKRDSDWFVKDARGNDVTDMSLTLFDGICTLIPEYGSTKLKDKRDETSKYSSIQDSVEYYD
ncbi:MAG: hypothetical protein ACTSYJ_04430 [Candidatus Thorarchaeota archaeon]